MNVSLIGGGRGPRRGDGTSVEELSPSRMANSSGALRRNFWGLDTARRQIDFAGANICPRRN